MVLVVPVLVLEMLLVEAIVFSGESISRLSSCMTNFIAWSVFLLLSSLESIVCLLIGFFVVLLFVEGF